MSKTLEIVKCRSQPPRQSNSEGCIKSSGVIYMNAMTVINHIYTREYQEIDSYL